MKTLSIYSIFIFLLTGYYHEVRAQVVGGQGRVESSAPKSSDKKNSVLQNGFYANVLFQGVFGRVRLIDYGTSYLIDPAFSIGFDIGNVWYLGKSTKYGNGISVIWARTNYNFQEDASGDLSVVQSTSILNVGFASAIAFNDNMSIEGSLNIGPNLTAGFEPNEFYVFGWTFTSSLRFRHKRTAVGIDVSITNGTDTDALYTLSNTYIGLTICSHKLGRQNGNLRQR